MEVKTPIVNFAALYEQARVAALQEMREARRGVAVGASDLLDHYQQALLEATSEREQLQDDYDSLHAHAQWLTDEMLQDIANLTKERDQLYKTNRVLVGMVRDKGKEAPLWLGIDWGREGQLKQDYQRLTQDYVSQRTESRLGVMPWLA